MLSLGDPAAVIVYNLEGVECGVAQPGGDTYLHRTLFTSESELTTESRPDNQPKKGSCRGKETRPGSTSFRFNQGTHNQTQKNTSNFNFS